MDRRDEYGHGEEVEVRVDENAFDLENEGLRSMREIEGRRNSTGAVQPRYASQSEGQSADGESPR